MWDGPFLSSKATSHRRASLTTLTPDFSQTLEVKWGGQNWTSSIQRGGVGRLAEHLPRCVPQRSRAGKPSSYVVVYSKEPSQLGAPALWAMQECVCLCVWWKWDRERMVTDRNVIHPLIINAPHLIQPDTHCYTHINRAINTHSHLHMLVDSPPSLTGTVWVMWQCTGNNGNLCLRLYWSLQCTWNWQGYYYYYFAHLFSGYVSNATQLFHKTLNLIMS